jgi:protein-L-isoaspartate(D-aspartate) O-methyltransferase
MRKEPDALRKAMVASQIAARGVRDPRVLQAMGSVPRHVFVPEDLRGGAYDDEPLPIGHGQTISQPFIVAYMTEALALRPEDRVLEIGTGSGYQTAVLAEIVREVWTVEVVAALAERARETLGALGYANVLYRVGDGSAGWAAGAPFDAIIVTAAPETVPAGLRAQLRDGGRMIVPIGRFGQDLILVRRTGETFDEERLLAVRFVPLIAPKEEGS